MKANVRGKGRLWQRQRTVQIFTDDTGFFIYFLHPAGCRVGNFWMRRMEQETVTLALVNLRSSCEWDEKNKSTLDLFTHTDVLKEKSKLWQNPRSHLFSHVIIYWHNTCKGFYRAGLFNSYSIGPDSKTRTCRWARHFVQNGKLTLSRMLLIFSIIYPKFPCVPDCARNTDCDSDQTESFFKSIGWLIQFYIKFIRICLF